jgi:hypothetical protein
MHLTDDLLLIEPVDAAGRPVPVGVPSAKVYLTNLYNLTLPLIRYEITDEVTLLDEPCACGSRHRHIEDIRGRNEDGFVYPDGRSVHPYVFESALAGERNVVEYQVLQTRRGASVAVVCQGEVDLEELRDGLGRAECARDRRARRPNHTRGAPAKTGFRQAEALRPPWRCARPRRHRIASCAGVFSYTTRISYTTRNPSCRRNRFGR